MRLHDYVARSPDWFRYLIRPRTVLRLALFAALVATVVAAGSIAWIRVQADDLEYSVDSVPAADVALVPGAEVRPNGAPSGYLAARLDIAGRLLASGKVKALLLSGDNSIENYDEPTAMRRYLIRKGVPADKIALDYAGFSTYDSCVRAFRIFGVREAIVVTQDFSMPRTIALCRSAGITTTGVADSSEGHDFTYYKCWLRDQLAATKAVFAMLSRPDPKFLGNQETSVHDAIKAPSQYRP